MCGCCGDRLRKYKYKLSEWERDRGILDDYCDFIGWGDKTQGLNLSHTCLLPGCGSDMKDIQYLHHLKKHLFF